tara:strand:+ start:3604 stop:4416 length:813 start_codon:yes stop_codon:yes gene_type:complete
MNNKELKEIALNLRKKIIEISYISKAHHVGSELSCIDILVSLYFKIMNVYPKEPKNQDRDYFILSKGHAALALYVTLMQRGFFSENFLKKEFLSDGGQLGGHPDKDLEKGIEISSGSLGQGLAIGAGISLINKKDNKKNKTFVLLGDGECNEGMIWETALFASHQKLSNLLAIIDYNKLQGLGSTTKIINLEPLKEKFQSFGWNTVEVDGHDIDSIISVIEKLFLQNDKPNLLIANTVKGKGVPFMENRFESHYEVLDKKKYEEAIKKLK